MKNKITSRFKGWDEVAKHLLLIKKNSEKDQWLNNGQRDSIMAIAKRIPQNGMIIADEVGMGKTRIAVALSKAVVLAGGRVAILIPPGLGYQWQEEFRSGKINDLKDPLRSMNGYFKNWPDSGWFSESIIFVSHLFSNWRLSEKSDYRRFALLPEVYAWARKQKGKIPRNYTEWSHDFSYDDIEAKAKMIVDSIPKDRSNPARKTLEKILQENWSKNFFIGSNYAKNESYRNDLESVVGIGLGMFDLVIIDEAHKNRGTNSGLSKLLGNILCTDRHHRVLGLTATPIELGLEDWTLTLQRIGIDQDLESIKNTIKTYSKAVENVRESWKFSPENRVIFADASRKFENALKKYLIRRDKRNDSSVKAFEIKSKLPYYQYREEREVLIDPLQDGFPNPWRKAICAAESLSFISGIKEDFSTKRLRLTIASGHGIGAKIDVITVDQTDKDDCKTKSDMASEEELISNDFRQKQKKEDRKKYWENVISSSLSTKGKKLLQHPGIRAAIKCIEEDYTKHNHKVLVFGKFTAPMKELVALLNAREMVRRLDAGNFWPQYTLRREEEYHARVAITQLKGELQKEWDIEGIRKALSKNERKIEASKKKYRKLFLNNVREGFIEKGINESSIAYKIIHHLESNLKKNDDLFLLLTRACYELVFGTELIKEETIDPVAHCEKYIELISAITDMDVAVEENELDTENPEMVESVMRILHERIKEEFSSQSARFARFMYGETDHHARRVMQLAFNRPDSFPYVLVAQSRVGKEGLNLHKACRAVIMLHPEWNPAVAEQQIGRVDRLDSLWSKMITDYDGDGKNTPRIEVRPVIFKNTYDEQNWHVLRARWDNLRAQLHGIIITERMEADCGYEDLEIIHDLNKKAPKFIP